MWLEIQKFTCIKKQLQKVNNIFYKQILNVMHNAK